MLRLISISLMPQFSDLIHQMFIENLNVRSFHPQ